MKKCRIQIFGRVQGVAFRYYTKKKGDELGLKGSTENQVDGSVLTFIIGQKERVDAFIEWCYVGSPASIVDRVEVDEMPLKDKGEYTDFSILR